MRLVVDTSVLVGELLRERGRKRLSDDRLELFLPEQTWDEVQVHLPRRIAAFARRRGLTNDRAEQIKEAAFDTIAANVDIVDRPVYSDVEDEARARSLRDPDDWPLVACALILAAGIWANDNDLLGTGVPTWTTQTLDGWLDRHPDG